MNENPENRELFDSIVNKASLKQDVYYNTYETFNQFKTGIKELVREFQNTEFQSKRIIPFEYKNRGEFEVELKLKQSFLCILPKKQ